MLISNMAGFMEYFILELLKTVFCFYCFIRTVDIKVFGGEAGPAATLAPKLGPLGLV